MGLAVGATLALYRYTYGQAELERATGYTPGSEDDPSVKAIRAQLALPSSHPFAEAEALYDKAYAKVWRLIGESSREVSVRDKESRSMTILRKKSFWIMVLLAAALLFPFETTVVPPKSVLVLTEDRKPIEGASVRQIWQNYSLESDGHEQDLTTNESGRVTFPRRTIRANILKRAVRPIWNIFRQGIHASYGIHTEILELGGGNVRRESAVVEPHAGEVVFRRR